MMQRVRDATAAVRFPSELTALRRVLPIPTAVAALASADGQAVPSPRAATMLFQSTRGIQLSS